MNVNPNNAGLFESSFFFGGWSISFIPAGTQRPRNVPWGSPKGPNVGDFQGTFRWFLRDQYQNWWFNEKKVFRYFLLEKKNIQKFQIGTSTGRLLELVVGCTGGQMMGRSGDVRGRRSYIFFKSNSETY